MNAQCFTACIRIGPHPSKGGATPGTVGTVGLQKRFLKRLAHPPLPCRAAANCPAADASDAGDARFQPVPSVAVRRLAYAVAACGSGTTLGPKLSRAACAWACSLLRCLADATSKSKSDKLRLVALEAFQSSVRGD